MKWLRSFVFKHWPLAWKSDVHLAWDACAEWVELATEECDRRKGVEADLGRVRASLAEMTAGREAAEAMMASMQHAYAADTDARLTNDRREFMGVGARKPTLLDKLIREIESPMGGRHVEVFLKRPTFTIEDGPAAFKPCGTRRYELLRFAWEMALTEECPPELVADQLARQVKAAVLKQWQHQSMLLPKKP